MRIGEHRPESWRSALRRGAKSEQAPNEVAGAVASDPDEGDRLLDGGANAPAGGDFAEVIHRYAGEWSENRARDRGVGAGAGVRTATKDGDRSRKNRGERYEARAERVCEANRGEVASPCSWENGVGRGAGLPTSRPHRRRVVRGSGALVRVRNNRTRSLRRRPGAFDGKQAVGRYDSHACAGVDPPGSSRSQRTRVG